MADILIMLIDDLNEALVFGEASILDDGSFYFRHDFPSGDDMDEEHCDCIQELKRHGWEFVYDDDSPYVEHDCITGDIVPITDKPT